MTDELDRMVDVWTEMFVRFVQAGMSEREAAALVDEDVREWYAERRRARQRLAAGGREHLAEGSRPAAEF